ncbi:hypothetical protein DVH24_014628 [Malus domestica]|uniref:Uncharacterized protein n=1 Tax=Malus domestica TaxID=3750 RepID=A0A498KQN0_MALDO|nr:hypothetical protein DVH24_014628 [Malus domestica]
MEDGLSSSKKSQKIVGFEGPYRLLYCSGKGDKAGVMRELEKGVEPNLADYNKRTALHLASCEGHTEIKGADVNSTYRWGRTPLSDARSLSQEVICKILEAKGGIDPVGLDSQLPCYEVNHTEVNMDEAALIGEKCYTRWSWVTQDRYMAPEVYRRESYGMSIDIFSIALIVHEVSFRNLRLKLLKAWWHQNPDCRPTFQDIILQLEEIQAAFQDKMKMGNCSGACVIS